MENFSNNVLPQFDSVLFFFGWYLDQPKKKLDSFFKPFVLFF